MVLREGKDGIAKLEDNPERSGMVIGFLASWPHTGGEKNSLEGNVWRRKTKRQ